MNGEVRSELKRHWPRAGSLRKARGGRGGRGGFFNRPLRPARCYSSTSCTSLSVATAGTGGCLSRKFIHTGANGAPRLSTSFVCTESRYSCGPNVSSSSDDNPDTIESLLSYHNFSSAWGILFILFNILTIPENKWFCLPDTVNFSVRLTSIYSSPHLSNI